MNWQNIYKNLKVKSEILKRKSDFLKILKSGMKENEKIYLYGDKQIIKFVAYIFNVCNYKSKLVIANTNTVHNALPIQSDAVISDIVAQKGKIIAIYSILEKLNTCILAAGEINHFYNMWTVNNELISLYKNTIHDNMLSISQIDFMITEKCSLKCSECLNLMQYYEKPQNLSLALLKKTIRDFMESVDEIGELHILGGEPFMNPEIYEICQYTASFSNIKSVVIFSNGTIVPNEEKLKLLDKEKTIFYFSEYGVEKQRIDSIIEILKKKHFLYHKEDYTKEKWIKHSAFLPNNLGKESIDELYAKCDGRKCPTILSNKFFVCEYIANAVRLGAIPYDAGNWISIEETKDLKMQLKTYMKRDSAPNACYFCDRLVYRDEASKQYVEPGRQLKLPLEYKRISENTRG